MKVRILDTSQDTTLELQRCELTITHWVDLWGNSPSILKGVPSNLGAVIAKDHKITYLGDDWIRLPGDHRRTKIGMYAVKFSKATAIYLGTHKRIEDEGR